MSNSKNSAGIGKAALSVVNIIATNSSASSGYRVRENQEIVGSGIIISDDGYIITNLHIIDRKKEINVELDDGRIRIANVIGYDQRSDLAVIKITSQEPLAPIKLANSKSIRVGDEVFAIGNAFGLGKTFTSGIVSATGRDYGNPYLELIQT
ncbi:S1C family serine protease, partial [Gammaproteobacteria bacterium]|nr:S1C family serine protease [Gammaproteobacteria bacterium]